MRITKLQTNNNNKIYKVESEYVDESQIILADQMEEFIRSEVDQARGVVEDERGMEVSDYEIDFVVELIWFRVQKLDVNNARRFEAYQFILDTIEA